MNNSQKGISTIKDVLIVVVAIVLIGGGAFAYKYWWVPRVSENIQNDETADWKTYTNTQYGFEIKYPSDWITEKNNSETRQTWLYPPLLNRGSVNNLFSITFRNKLGDFYSYCGASDTKTKGVMTREIEVLENVNNDTIDTLVEKYSIPGYVVEITNIGNLKAANIREEGIGGNFSRIYTIKNDKIYIFGEEDSCDVASASNNDNAKILSDEIFNQMLSTFKFLK